MKNVLALQALVKFKLEHTHYTKNFPLVNFPLVSQSPISSDGHNTRQNVSNQQCQRTTTTATRSHYGSTVEPDDGGPRDCKS